MNGKVKMDLIIKDAEKACMNIRERLEKGMCIPNEVILKEKEISSRLLDPMLDTRIDVESLNEQEAEAVLYLMCIAVYYTGKINISLSSDLRKKLKLYFCNIYNQFFCSKQYSIMGDFYEAIYMEIELQKNMN